MFNLIAFFMINYIPGQFYKRGSTFPKRDYVYCPFGVRDLKNDECYSGSGVNRCKYFRRYDWSESHYGCIACSCNLPVKGKVIQLEFDFV